MASGGILLKGVRCFTSEAKPYREIRSIVRYFGIGVRSTGIDWVC